MHIYHHYFVSLAYWLCVAVLSDSFLAYISGVAIIKVVCVIFLMNTERFAHGSENSTQGTKGPRSESSMDLSILGTFVPVELCTWEIPVCQMDKQR